MVLTLPAAHDGAAGPRGVRPLRSGAASAGLAVHRVATVATAELLQLEPVGVVAPVLLGDVVALLALRAGQSDLGADIGALAGHGTARSLGTSTTTAERVREGRRPLQTRPW